MRGIGGHGPLNAGPTSLVHGEDPTAGRSPQDGCGTDILISKREGQRGTGWLLR